MGIYHDFENDPIEISTLEQLYYELEPYMKSLASRYATSANGSSALLNKDDYFGEMQLALIGVYEKYFGAKTSEELIKLAYTTMRNCCIVYYNKQMRLSRATNKNSVPLDDLIIVNEAADEEMRFVVLINRVMQRLSQEAKDVLQAYLGNNALVQLDYDLKYARHSWFNRPVRSTLLKKQTLMDLLALSSEEVDAAKLEIRYAINSEREM